MNEHPKHRPPEEGKRTVYNPHSLKWICRAAKPHALFITGLIVLTGVSATFGTATALISKGLIDSATDGKMNMLIRYCAVFLLLAIAQIASMILSRYYTEKCRAKLDITFKKRMFSQELFKRYPLIRVYHSGDLVNRLTGDVGVITDAIVTIPANIASVAVRLICAMAALLTLQWQFAIIFAVGGVLIYVITRLLREKIKFLHREMQKAEGRSRSFWQEVTENLLVIKSFSAEEKSVEKSDELLEEHYRVRMRKARMGAFSSGANHLIMRLGYIFAMAWCALKLFAGSMTFGSLTAITSLVGQVQQPFMSLSGIVPRYYAALSSAERLMEIENITDEERHGENKISDVEKAYSSFKGIKVDDVTFAYDKDNVIENVSVFINKGDFISITGASGIGKSTLFKLLLDIYPISSGKIQFCFEQGTLEVSPEIRKLFAYVPQGNLLFSGTIRENLLFMSDDKTDEQINHALHIACADTFMSEIPGGLDSFIGESGLGLSEGQIQRLAVARAILNGAPILMLDEATSALDEATEAKMLSNIRSLTDKTCMIVTHKKAALDICNRHLIMKDRKMTESDKPQTLQV